MAAAGRWAKAANLNPDGPLAPWRESEYLTLARVLIAQGQAEKAMPILESFSQSAAAAKRNGNLIEILAVEATALHASGQSDAALDRLKQALALAEDADYARVFVDEGEPMKALLHQVYQQSKKNREDHSAFSRGYVERLLLELRGDGENTVVEKAETNDHKDRLVEPLSERELEILRLIAAGRSNRQIAGKLFVAPSIIKWHIGNTYGKLNVRTRTQAIARARQLGML